MPARKTTPPSEISFYGLLMWRGKEYPYETLLFNWQSGQYFILGPGPLKAAGMTLKVPNSCWVFLFTNPFFKLIGTRSKQSLFCLRLEPDKKVLLCYLFPVWKEIRSAFFEKPHQRFLDLFFTFVPEDISKNRYLCFHFSFKVSIRFIHHSHDNICHFRYGDILWTYSSLIMLLFSDSDRK